MFRIITTLFFIQLFSLNNFSQAEKSSNIGLNIATLMGTTIELGYELNTVSSWSFDGFLGVTINNKSDGFFDKPDEPVGYNKNQAFLLK